MQKQIDKILADPAKRVMIKNKKINNTNNTELLHMVTNLSKESKENFLNLCAVMSWSLNSVQ